MLEALHHTILGTRSGRTPTIPTTLLLLLIAVSAVTAGGGEPRFVERVDAASSPTSVEMTLITGGTAAPEFSLFGLREPDRLVIDLPGFGWQPGVTAHLASAFPHVSGVRAGEFSADPPITRIVLDLTVPAQDLRHQISALGEKGTLRFEFTHEPGAGITPGVVVGAPLQQVYSIAWQPEPSVDQSKPGPGAEAPVAVAPAAAVEPVDRPATVGLETETGEDSSLAPVTARVAPRSAPSSQEARTAGARLRVIIAASIVLAAVLGAALARRRCRAGESGFAEPPSPAAAQRADSADDAGAVHCRVASGHLVLVPEEGSEAFGGSGAATIEQARLEVTVERGEAIYRPQEVGSERAQEVEALLRSLNDESAEARKAAAAGLVELVRRGESSALVPHLTDSDPRVRATVAGALGEGGAADCARALSRLIEDPEPSVRASVLYAYSQLGAAAADYAGAVRARFHDDEDAVSAVAIEALAGIFPYSDQVAAEVLSLASSSKPLVRQAAAAASFEFALRGVTRPLLELLSDLSRRAQALELLQQAGDAVLRKLAAAARQAPDDLAESATEALSYVMSRRWTVEDFAAELDSPDAEIRLAALEGLSVVGGEAAAREANRLARSDPSARVRERAGEILRGWRQRAAEEEAASSRS